MRRSDLDYHLPDDLIAQHPCEPRDAARLMVIHRATGEIELRVFRDIGSYLARGDCMVVNNTRVIPARFHCRRASGGRIEVLFIHSAEGPWHALLRPSARLRAGERLTCEGADTEIELLERLDRGEWRVRPHPEIDALQLLGRIGSTPLPPYVQRAETPNESDQSDYQTVYAARPGAVAAPTAGLHFTPALLSRLTDAGVERAEVTLHVGPGTFLPIEAEDLSQHAIHAEWFEVQHAAAERINSARSTGGRIVAVGTTSARALETIEDVSIRACSGWTRCFIYPPYRLRHVDVLLTNFHLPQSTLIALVMAFAGIELTRRAYATAVRERFRFYSYGDAMLIL